MKNLLALVGLVVVLVGGLGWYLGWYKIGTQSGGNGHTEVKVDVDGNEIKKDVKKAEDAAKGFLNHNGKSVPATPTSRPLEPPSSGWNVPTSQLPPLPPPPSSGAVELNPDGTLKIKVNLPPPQVFPGQK